MKAKRPIKHTGDDAHRMLVAPCTPAGSPSLAELAAQQGVKPVQDIDELVGDFWPAEESADEFVATIRAWREAELPSTRS